MIPQPSNSSTSLYLSGIWDFSNLFLQTPLLATKECSTYYSLNSLQILSICSIFSFLCRFQISTLLWTSESIQENYVLNCLHDFWIHKKQVSKIFSLSTIHTCSCKSICSCSNINYVDVFLHVGLSQTHCMKKANLEEEQTCIYPLNTVQTICLVIFI